MMNWNEFDKWAGVLCAWREARGEGRDGIRAVLHVIQNRSVKAKQTWAQIVYQRLQFSSMTFPGDPQLTLVPTRPDPNFVTCFEVAELIYAGGDFDLTYGATHYFGNYIQAPEWSQGMTQTAKIGKHVFFK